MEHDPEEIYAELDAECQRVGVRVDDVLTWLTARTSAVDGIRFTSFDVALTLECLRSLPTNAGTSMLLDCMRVQLREFLGQRSDFAALPRKKQFELRPSIERILSRDMAREPS